MPPACRRVSFRAASAKEVMTAFKSPEKARERNGQAVLACSFDTPSAKDESGKGNHGTISGVQVGKGKVGNAIWFRKTGKKPGGNSRQGSYFVQRDWNHRVPIFAQAMAVAGDTLLVAGPPDLMDEEYTFDRIMEGDKSIDALLKKQDAALSGATGGKLLAVSKTDGSQQQEVQLDALPVWDGMAVANGSLYVADKDGKITRFGSK